MDGWSGKKGQNGTRQVGWLIKKRTSNLLAHNREKYFFQTFLHSNFLVQNFQCESQKLVLIQIGNFLCNNFIFCYKKDGMEKCYHHNQWVEKRKMRYTLTFWMGGVGIFVKLGRPFLGRYMEMGQSRTKDGGGSKRVQKNGTSFMDVPLCMQVNTSCRHQRQ